MSGYLDFMDFGEDWVIWTQMTSDEHADLRETVEDFESLDNPAGRRCTEWLRHESLRNHPSTVTHLLVVGRRVEAFFALCSGQAKLSQRHRREIQGDVYSLAPVQPMAHVAWIAKHRDSQVEGGDVLAQAAAVALEVIDAGQGQVALSLNAYDDETAQLWQERYGFRRSQAADDRVNLWRTLLDNPDE